MKINENQKVTLTIGQLKKLIRESEEAVSSEQRDKDIERVGEVLGDLYRTAAGEGDLGYTNRLQCAEKLKKIIQMTDLTLIKSMSDPVDPRIDAAYRAVDALIEELRA